MSKQIKVTTQPAATAQDKAKAAQDAQQAAASKAKASKGKKDETKPAPVPSDVVIVRANPADRLSAAEKAKAALRVQNQPKAPETKAATKPEKKFGDVLFHFFHITPRGAMLRAYWIAIIEAQAGEVKAGATFKLWPGANFAGHLDAQRMVRIPGGFRLTQAGADVLTMKRGDQSLIDTFREYITTGKAPRELGSMGIVQA